MKSRFIRALAVGAALLIPVGSLAVLGGGVAGAKTKLLQAGSRFTVGSGFIPIAITLKGITLNYTTLLNTASGRTIGPTLKAQVSVKNSLTKVASGAKVTLTGTGATAGKNGCVITINRDITFTTHTTTQLDGSLTPTAAQITVTGCTTPSITAIIKSEIAGKMTTVKLI